MSKVTDSITSKIWWKAAGTRALKTVAQGALGAIGGTALFTGVSWEIVLSTAALSGIISLLTSIAGLPEIDLKENDEDAANE